MSFLSFKIEYRKICVEEKKDCNDITMHVQVQGQLQSGSLDFSYLN